MLTTIVPDVSGTDGAPEVAGATGGVTPEVGAAIGVGTIIGLK